MGCGSSGATATKSENAAELKKENQEKQEMEDNTPEVFNYPGCALLYVEPGTFTLYDLTDTFISPEGHRLYEDASLGTENPNNQNLSAKLSSASQIDLIIDVGFFEPVLFLAQIIPTLGLPTEQFCYFFVTPDSETPSLYMPNILSMYRLYVSVAAAQNDQINFVERSFFYANGVEKLAKTVSLIMKEREKTSFHPFGEQTSKQLKELSDDIQEGLWSNRAGALSIINAGLEEGHVSQGCEALYNLLDSLPKQSYSGSIPQCQSQHPIVIEQKEPIVVAALGTRAKSFQSKLANTLNLTCKQIQDKEQGASKEILFLVDAETITSEEVDLIDEARTYNQDSATIIGFILPQDFKSWYKFGINFSYFINMVKAVILLPCDASDEGKYIDFLNALVTIDYSWFSLYDHLVPWPRLMYLTPFFGPSPMVSGNFGAIVENGVRSIVTINQDLTLDEKFFTGQAPGYASTLRGDSVTCPNFKGGLIANFQENTNIFADMKEQKEKCKEFVGPQHAGAAENVWSNISDLYQEYNQYSEIRKEEDDGNQFMQGQE